jgi:hypothetical protein
MTSGSAPLGAPPGSASWKRRRRRERRRRRRHLGAPTSRRPVKEATARRCVGFSLAFHSPCRRGRRHSPGCRRDVGVPRRVPTRRRRSQEGADATSAFPGGCRRGRRHSPGCRRDVGAPGGIWGSARWRSRDPSAIFRRAWITDSFQLRQPRRPPRHGGRGRLGVWGGIVRGASMLGFFGFFKGCSGWLK